ncbi:hypothetical protein K469DRAFT_766116, partial [Zopfia rhizophila CBS 207.26]
MDELVMASYFFWAPGTPLQKNQEGLFRTLLYPILKRRGDLIPHLFPKQFSSLVTGQAALEYLKILRRMEKHLEIASVTLVELREASLSPSRVNLGDLKVAFFVDGLDEYHGNQSDMVDLFK